MSTLDPGLEPPGDWQTPYSPSSYSPSGIGSRAAIYLWLSAGIQLAMSACCGLAGVGFMLMSTEQIMEAMPPDLPDRQEAINVAPVMGPAMAIGSLLLLFIPALILVILAFRVRTSKRTSTITSLVILSIQSAGLALLTLFYLFMLFATLMPQLIILVLIMGSMLVLFIKTILELANVLKQTENTQNQTNMW